MMNHVSIDDNHDLDDVYKEAILELNRHPMHKKVIDPADVVHNESNPICGDDVTLYLVFDGDMITDVGHQGQGCAISQAAVSLVLDAVKGRTKEEVLAMTKEDMLELLGIPISHTRLKCALIGWKALQKAITM